MYWLSWNYIKEKWAHMGFQKYLQNTGWLFSSRVLSMIIAFFTTAFIARKLGPGNYGQLSYAVSFVGIFGVLAGLGIDNVLYRELIKNPDKRREYLGSAFFIKLITGIITTILIIIATLLGAQDDVSKVLIFILSGMFIFNSFQIISYEFQAKVQSKYPSIIAFLVTLILNILKIIVVVNGKGVIYLAFILLLESVLYATFYLFTYEKKLGETIFQWKFDKNIVLTLIRDSWPLIFTSAFALIYARIDQIFIKHMIDARAVGIYGAGVTIAEAWYFIPNIIMSSVFPAIINAKKTSEEIYHGRIKKLFILLFLLSIIVASATMIFAPLIIQIIYGNAFAGASTILQIYVWSNVGIFFGSLVTNYLIAENYRKILFVAYLIPMISNVVLNLLWIPKYGIVGSAYATLISYTLGPLAILLFKTTRNQLIKIIKNK